MGVAKVDVVDNFLDCFSLSIFIDSMTHRYVARGKDCNGVLQAFTLYKCCLLTFVRICRNANILQVKCAGVRDTYSLANAIGFPVGCELYLNLKH